MAPETRRSSFLPLLAAVVLPAVIVMAIYAVPFVRDPSTLPFGRDTAGYIWRSNVAHDLGLLALRGDPKGLGDRPGHPAAVAVLRSLTGQDGLSAAWIMPLVMTAAVALAAGALGLGGANGSGRAALAAAAGTGASTLIAWTAVGYAANLMFDSVALAFALVLIHAMRGRRGSLAASAILLGGATSIHWVFALVTIAIVGPIVLAYELWPARLLSVGAVSHPRRPTLALGAGIATAGAAMLMAPELPGSLPSVRSEHIANFVSLRSDSFGLPLVAGLGLIGLSAGLFRRRELWSVSMLACWTIPAGVGLVAWSVFDLPTPPYRWIGFALGLPLLASFSGPWLLERLRVRREANRWAVTLVALVPAGLLAASGAQVWWTRSPRLEPATFAELETVASYLHSSVPEGVPVIASIRPSSPGRAAGLALRAGLPGTRALEATTMGLRYRRDAEAEVLPIQPPDAVVLHLRSFRSRPPPTGTVLGPGVWLLQGPAPRAPVVPGEAPHAPAPGRFTLVALGWLGLLGVAGYGWTRPLGVSVGERAGLAPAFGVAATVLASVLLARVGVRPAGWGAILTVAAAAAAGWVWSVVIPGRPGDVGPQPDP